MKMDILTQCSVSSAHMKDSYQFFYQTIKNNGPLSVAEFMCLVLTHPKYGYYTTKNAIGLQEDFITAPHISQIFNELISAFVAYCWHGMGCIEKWSLVELGAHDGTMINALLSNMAKFRPAVAKPNVVVVDVNKRSFELPDGSSVQARETIDLPSSPCIIIANEFFDAMPIHQFCYDQNGWCEVVISAEKDKLCFLLSKPASTAYPYLNRIKNPFPGMIVESSPASEALIDLLGQHIQNHMGVVLIIDYGYLEQRTISSLHSICNHKAVNVLEHPGCSDISAHVNFDALRDVCIKRNLYCQIVTQEAFLHKIGIKERVRALCKNASPEQKSLLLKAVRRLTDDDEMGKLFKVMIVSSFPLGI